jgi:hypothetical protein
MKTNAKLIMEDLLMADGFLLISGDETQPFFIVAG